MVVMQLRWMTFVDGENFTLQGEKLAKEEGVNLIASRFWRPGDFLWAPKIYNNQWRHQPQVHPPTVSTDSLYVGYAGVPLEEHGIRSTYYTAVQGDDSALESTIDVLSELGFDPRVFKKPKGRQSKGVDITLTRDVLAHAFRGNFEVLVLIAGDADYVPLVEEVKRLGKRVHISYFEEKYGFSPQLRRHADSFCGSYLTDRFLRAWREYKDWVSRGEPTN